MKKIPNSKDYYVDYDGSIYKGKNKLKCNNQNGYRAVMITYKDGSRKRWYVHRIVAEIYLENKDRKPFVNHIDGDKANNSVSNLEWVTCKENARHASDTGLIKSGEDSRTAIYSNKQIHDVCKMLQENCRVNDISVVTKVCRKTVTQIKTQKQWLTISCQYNIPKGRGALSFDTVKWICSKFEDGLSIQDVLDLTTNKNITYQRCWQIFKRKTHIKISKDYKF